MNRVIGGTGGGACACGQYGANCECVARSDAMMKRLFETPTPTKPGWPCPACGGIGTKQDGKLDIGPGSLSFTPPSKCDVCRGAGRVKVVPLEEETP